MEQKPLERKNIDTKGSSVRREREYLSSDGWKWIRSRDGRVWGKEENRF